VTELKRKAARCMNVLDNPQLTCRHYLFALFKRIPMDVIAYKKDVIPESHQAPTISVTTEVGTTSFQFTRKTFSSQLNNLPFQRY